jgi:hypothetical protein
VYNNTAINIIAMLNFFMDSEKSFPFCRGSPCGCNVESLLKSREEQRDSYSDLVRNCSFWKYFRQK